MENNSNKPVQERKPLPFTSALSRGEGIAVLLYLPLHLVLLPILLGMLCGWGLMDESGINLALYMVGFLYMLGLCFRFLRRDFDVLCDRPWQVIAEIMGSYGVMLCCNMLFSMAAGYFIKDANPNNEAVTAMAMTNYGPTAAMAIYLAPVVEELLFRAGIFGLMRRRSRIAAYVLSVLAFSVYHVWGFALTDPIYWIYVLQYIPVSYLLCRCYESTNSIWTPIFFHMLVNGVSLKMLTMLQELM